MITFKEIKPDKLNLKDGSISAFYSAPGYFEKLRQEQNKRPTPGVINPQLLEQGKKTAESIKQFGRDVISGLPITKTIADIKGGMKPFEAIKKGYSQPEKDIQIRIQQEQAKQKYLKEGKSEKEANLLAYGLPTESQKEEMAQNVMAFAGGLENVAGKEIAPIFKGFKDLTTKVLNRLEGKFITSKQEILDFTNMPELKQTERDLIRNVVNTYKTDKIPVQEFANKVKSELLPLSLERPKGSPIKRTAYENITLPDELRGKVSNYSEHIWNSPIKTSAGGVHFGSEPNYFGHTRIEDMAPEWKVGNTTFFSENTAKKFGTPVKQPEIRRIIEVQSDLYQKGKLDYELTKGIPKSLEKRIIKEYLSDIQIAEEMKKLGKGKNIKLAQYIDPTAHFRMVREEVKQAAIDGKTKLQFPTGETAMKIEGLGINLSFVNETLKTAANPENIKVGHIVSDPTGENWIITDIISDGKFKAVPASKTKLKELEMEEYLKRYPHSQETFDISDKIDINNPIYKFYEKDMGKYLKNKYNAQQIIDKQGVSWLQVDIKPEMAKVPVEAFGIGIIPFLKKKDKEKNK